MDEDRSRRAADATEGAASGREAGRRGNRPGRAIPHLDERLFIGDR